MDRVRVTAAAKMEVIHTTMVQGGTFVVCNFAAATTAYNSVPLARGGRAGLPLGAVAANYFAFNAALYSGGRDAHLFYLGMATSTSMSAGVFGLHAWRAATPSGKMLTAGWAMLCGALATPLWYNTVRTAQ